MPQAQCMISLRLTEEDKRLLQAIAEREGRSMSNMLIYLIRKEAERQGVNR